jgi:hypothetical protein
VCFPYSFDRSIYVNNKLQTLIYRVSRCPVFDRTVRFLAICPVEKMGLNRSMSCPIFRPLLKLLMKSAADRNIVFTLS